MPLLNTLLSDLEDPEVRDVIQDLCGMLQWSEAKMGAYSLFLFLQAAMTRPAAELKLAFLPGPSVLGSKLEKLRAHGFYRVCAELKGGGSLELHDRETLLAFLKRHFASHRPAKKRGAPTRADRWDSVIRQRRVNRG